MTLDRLGSSFRDPSGFVFVRDGRLYRQVNPSYSAHYDLLMSSGLYQALVDQGWLVPHQELEAARVPPGAYRVLEPQTVPYISYPYEWCFSQLKDAALLTLDIQISSLSYGMVLKDASAYNVQFIGTRPVFIDTLSFETYQEGAPWVAYRQFCQHFLGPLALMAHRDVRLRQLLSRFIDGIPLDLVAELLPLRTRARYGLFAHIHLHARSQQRHHDDAGVGAPVRIPKLPKNRLIALMQSLRATVEGCHLPKLSTEWSDYYDKTNYSDEAMAAKEALVKRLVDATATPAGLTHDIGANTGRFSRLVAGPDRYVVSHDIDELAIERNYRDAKLPGTNAVLPLVLDVSNPSPAIGWALEERSSALERISGGTVIALALVHHLAISNNVPLPQLATLFARLAHTLIIEFVPKEDSQVRRLLATREDIFPDYTLPAFEAAFSALFEITHREAVPGTARTMFAMRRREAGL
ncbi:MAG TPA: class I SAM-dependent methyltransferase [Thermoanaerobaculia bacterium]|nr:class I SAM-dependent methyltransferase [Thermoanaerobaculia bacterium]